MPIIPLLKMHKSHLSFLNDFSHFLENHPYRLPPTPMFIGFHNLNKEEKCLLFQ